MFPQRFQKFFMQYLQLLFRRLCSLFSGIPPGFYISQCTNPISLPAFQNAIHIPPLAHIVLCCFVKCLANKPSRIDFLPPFELVQSRARERSQSLFIVLYNFGKSCIKAGSSGSGGSFIYYCSILYWVVTWLPVGIPMVDGWLSSAKT